MDGILVPHAHGERDFNHRFHSSIPWSEQQSPPDTQAVLTIAQNYRESARRGKWPDAKDSALALLSTVEAVSAALGCDFGCAGDIGRVGERDALWMASCSARSGLLLIASAFSAHAKQGLLEGAAATELSLATAASCAALMPDGWPAGAADDLLGMAGLVDALIRVTSVSTSHVAGFAVLRARRAAADLLAAALEAATASWRQLVETALLREAVHIAPMQNLVNALLGGSPDPRLHEVMLELLWRALRRVATGAALSALACGHPALAQLEYKLPGLSARIQELTPEDLLENAQEFALELNADGEPPAFACKLDETGNVAAAVFTEHSISFYQDDDNEPLWEIPWECIKFHRFHASRSGGTHLWFEFDGDMLRALTGVPLEAVLPTTVELLFDVPAWELQEHLRIRQSSSFEEAETQAHHSTDLAGHGTILSNAQGSKAQYGTTHMPGTVQPPASQERVLQQAPCSGSEPSFLFAQYMGSNTKVPPIAQKAALESTQLELPCTFDQEAALSSSMCNPEETPNRDQQDLPLSLTQTKLPRAGADVSEEPFPSDVVWVSDAEASPIKKVVYRDPCAASFSSTSEEEPARTLKAGISMGCPVFQAKPAPLTHPALTMQEHQATAQRAEQSMCVPDASKRLNQLFHGQIAGDGKPQPRARGYAALATGTLRALCKARGLPCSADRDSLLTQLHASLHAGRTPGAAASTSATAKKVQEPKRDQASGRCKKGPRDAVAKVLKDASRLAREVADVQRQFQQSKRTADIQGSEASALLDDIFRASKKHCQGA